MAGKKQPRTLAAQLVVAMACATLLSACGHSLAPIGAATSGSSTGGPAAPSLPSAPLSPSGDQETQPDQAASDSVAGPVNLPPIPAAPDTPVAPAQMQVRALASTNTLPVGAGIIPGFIASVIRAKVSWTPIKGAVTYNVYQGTPTNGQAVQGKGELIYKNLHWLPLVFVGGRLGPIGGVLNLKVNQEYDYTVDALDRAGNVIGEGQDNCAPLAPLSIPYLTSPGQNQAHVGASPYLSWTPSQGADGYYVEVFSTVGPGIPALPMWRGFRSDTSADNMLYGTQQDVMDGTSPMQWALPLNIGSRYAWSVSAVRTDTHDWNNCKALAEATAMPYYFQP